MGEGIRARGARKSRPRARYILHGFALGGNHKKRINQNLWFWFILGFVWNNLWMDAHFQLGNELVSVVFVVLEDFAIA